MKLLLTGVNGLLGQVLAKKLCEKKYTVVGTGKGQCRLIAAALENFSYKELDITDGPMCVGRKTICSDSCRRNDAGGPM
jgi:nucleoside-diphosphate-sugar epimerase